MPNPPGPSRATLRDLAEHAGVSRSTVSLVLRNSSLVAVATRARVREAMEAIGYVYDRGAARLRSGVSQTIGLVVSEITNPFYAELTAGIDTVLDRAGWVAFLANTGDVPARQERFLQRMREQKADGVLICPAAGTVVGPLREMVASGLPCVQILRRVGRPAIDPAIDYVGPDYRLGMVLAVEHLRARGHHRIGFIRSDRQSSATRERLDGFEESLARHSLVPACVAPCASSRGEAAALAASLVRGPNAATALICHNDVIALGILSGLQRLGLRAGTDVAVVGFDNIGECATAFPALTSIATGPADIGAVAADLLLRRIADPRGSPEQILMPPRLVVRET
ncbi:MAG TPA: LacI family DNA-binding transcriptional regulator [Acetobacteraceae bacterium]|nr:LacI family DNA-binding transcriptional regulator [Acetobacteraceae bacterium]